MYIGKVVFKIGGNGIVNKGVFRISLTNLGKIKQARDFNVGADAHKLWRISCNGVVGSSCYFVLPLRIDAIRIIAQREHLVGPFSITCFVANNQGPSVVRKGQSDNL